MRRSDVGVADDYGNATTVETTEAMACYLEQRRRSEDENLGEVSEADYLLVLPAGTDIDTGDEVIVGEHHYEMIGTPWVADNIGSARVGHVEATVRRTAGEEDLS